MHVKRCSGGKCSNNSLDSDRLCVIVADCRCSPCLPPPLLRADAAERVLRDQLPLSGSRAVATGNSQLTRLPAAGGTAPASAAAAAAPCCCCRTLMGVMVGGNRSKSTAQGSGLLGEGLIHVLRCASD